MQAKHRKIHHIKIFPESDKKFFQFYFEKAYNRYLELQLTDPLCCALLFDAAVNMGAGSMANFPMFNQGDVGSWIKAAINVLSRPERKVGWTKLLNQNFA